MGNFVMELIVNWNIDKLNIRLKRADRNGYIDWSIEKLVQTWAMTIHIEEWISNPDMESFMTTQTKG